MIRLVTEFVAQPYFLLLCDHHNCAQVSTRVVHQPSAPLQASDLTQISRAPNPLETFFAVALEGGWTVNPFQHICPQHTRQFSDKEPPRIVVPAGVLLQ